MPHKRLGNIVAVVIASALGWTLTPNIRPTQAEPSAVQTAAEKPAGVPHSGLALDPEKAPAKAEAAVEAKIPASNPLGSDTPALGLPAAEMTEGTGSTANVTKLGEPASTQTESRAESRETSQAGSKVDSQAQPAIAKVFPHNLDARPAATLYVRGIPVLTFLGESAPAGEAKLAKTSANSVKQPAEAGELRKLATQDSEPNSDENSPMGKASRLAAQLNQLQRSGDVDSSKISVKWDNQQYRVSLGETPLVTLTSDMILPDTTGARTEDALQVANRLRRLLGDQAAEPLTQVANLPKPKAAPVVASAQSFYQQGWASWYGPGFNGNQTANGEIFNQNAMTAAHLHLSFGTLVRVTNLDNGSSVTVRINDRGPYAGDRVIDLSAAAADYIGLTNAGVAPVRIDVLK